MEERPQWVGWLRLGALLGLLGSVIAAGFFFFLGAVWAGSSSPDKASGGEALRVLGFAAAIAGIVALCGVAAGARLVAAIPAGFQGFAMAWIADEWEKMEGFRSGGGDSGSLELAALIGGIIVVDALTVVWAARFRSAGVPRGGLTSL